MRLLDYSHDELPWDEEERWRQILAAVREEQKAQLDLVSEVVERLDREEEE